MAASASTRTIHTCILCGNRWNPQYVSVKGCPYCKGTGMVTLQPSIAGQDRQKKIRKAQLRKWMEATNEVPGSKLPRTLFDFMSKAAPQAPETTATDLLGVPRATYTALLANGTRCERPPKVGSLCTLHANRQWELEQLHHEPLHASRPEQDIRPVF